MWTYIKLAISCCHSCFLVDRWNSLLALSVPYAYKAFGLLKVQAHLPMHVEAVEPIQCLSDSLSILRVLVATTQCEYTAELILAESKTRLCSHARCLQGNASHDITAAMI